MPIPGQINSSTRSEAHGLLVGLCTKGPVHIGIDNRAVVDRACFLIALASKFWAERGDTEAMMKRIGLAWKNARSLRKPEANHWQMQKYGDVGYAIWRAIGSKRPQAIKVTKVKGHATKEDVADDRATVVDKSGSDVADSLVREATMLHGKKLVALAYWLEARHMTYKAFMAMIQKLIIQMHTVDKEERERRKTEANPFRPNRHPGSHHSDQAFLQHRHGHEETGSQRSALWHPQVQRPNARSHVCPQISPNDMHKTDARR